MGMLRTVRTEADYNAALARIDALMDARPGTPEGDELDVLVDLVELYESKHVPLGYPDPVTAIRFRMEQAGLSERELVPLLGSRSKVSEVLAGRRPITMTMARALHEHLSIPADVLLQQPPQAKDPLNASNIDWARFPLVEMARRGWIPRTSHLAERAEALIRELIARAGGAELLATPLYRKNDHARQNAKTDAYALKAWCWRVLAVANETRPPRNYRQGTVTLEFMREVAQLSWSAEGPHLAKEFLEKNGIPFVVESHLPRTYLDGAALRLSDGTPVVALTLRYDRLDNFWFCLLHELAHVGRHLDTGADPGFVDDMNLRDAPGARDPREIQADEWAEEALVPAPAWESSAASLSPTPAAVMSLAAQLRVHPAVIAGRVRHERRNYRLLSQFVGAGEVRHQFGAGAPGSKSRRVSEPRTTTRTR